MEVHASPFDLLMIIGVIDPTESKYDPGKDLQASRK